MNVITGGEKFDTDIERKRIQSIIFNNVYLTHRSKLFIQWKIWFDIEYERTLRDLEWIDPTERLIAAQTEYFHEADTQSIPESLTLSDRVPEDKQKKNL